MCRQHVRTPGNFQRSLHNDLASHASPLVRLAVVAVLSGSVELGGHSLSRGVEVVLVAQLVSVGSRLRSVANSSEGCNSYSFAMIAVPPGGVD